MNAGLVVTEGKVGRLAQVLLLVGVLLAPALAVADINYIYDARGRLVGVVDPASDTAVYAYDVVGNLLSIARYPSSTVSIIDMGTASAPVGAAVTISGTGFSSTPGSNTVTFNGIMATVISSTPTQLVATVPAGATTGSIVVTAPGGSTTAGTFTVTGSTAPAITSFTPGIGAAGTAVTISGSNFEPVSTSNRLTFNASLAAVGSATATSLGATVPVGATSGRLAVATPAGAAQSGGDFFVPPAGVNAADVVFTGRIAIDGSNLAGTITPANKAGLVVFDGTAGQAVSLGTHRGHHP